MEVRENLAGSGPKQAAREHLEELLDEALMATFPASDPIAVGRELLEVVEQQVVTQFEILAQGIRGSPR